MSEELEEAINRLKNKIKNDEKYRNSPFGDLIEEIMNDNKAIEIVLKALENSISKDKIKEERWRCIKEAGSYYIDNATIKQHKLIGGYEVLNKLLGDDKNART